MKLYKNYLIGFDVWALIVFLAVMIPTIIWALIPAPNDILRTESVTPIIDTVASILQFMALACLCVVINKDADKVRLSPLIILSTFCILMYYAGWGVYYSGICAPWVVLLMTIPPCLALILYASDRKNLPAIILTSGFTVCHLFFAIANFV